METITITEDIKVFYITAISFPEGVMAAHQKLHSLFSSSTDTSTDRKYFGISRPENGGGIVYKAAAEIKEREEQKFNTDTLVLKKGNYISLTVHDFMKHIPAIGQTFQQLLEYPGLDPDGYCVEWYLNEKDVQCMVRLAD